jgi:hypothetical protein
MTQNFPSKWLLALFFIGIGILASGCGDSDSAEASLTKKQFIKQADAICLKAEQNLTDQVVKYKKQNPKAEEEDLILNVGIRQFQGELDELEALGPPSGGEDEIDAMLDAFAQGISQAEETPLDVVSPGADPFKKADKLAAEYGLQVCRYAP